MDILKKINASFGVALGSVHILCCGLPAFIAITSLISNLGVGIIIPTALLDAHEYIHRYEQILLCISGGSLVFGWGVYWYSLRLNCVSEGCHHAPCAKKKDYSKHLMVIASIMFVINCFVYFNISGH